MQVCPFCGGPETDRVTIDGRRFLVFRCMFTPEVRPGLSETEIAEYLASAFPTDGRGGYFRGMCDQLHVYVTKGEGARRLLTPRPGRPGEGDPGSPPPAA